MIDGLSGTALTPIRLLLLDVDGVLTDGRIVYGDSGGEIKAFHVRDGFGIRMAMNAGIRIGIVTGRRSAALRHRCNDLGIPLLMDGITDKAAVLEKILSQTGLTANETAFMGDDLPDLPLMRRVGCGIAVADAHPVVREAANLVTRASGGNGAVREVCEALLAAQGQWEAVLERYRGPVRSRSVPQ